MLAPWLLRRECAYRWPLLLAELAVVAAAVALALGLELVSRGREAAVASQIDQMGPAFRIVPKGSSSVGRLRLEQLDLMLPADALERARSRLSAFARSIEPRLALVAPVASDSVALIGIPAGMNDLGVAPDLGSRELAVGEALAQRLGVGVASRMPLHGELFAVRQLVPSRGDEDDLAAFASLTALQSVARVSGRINELRLFPRIGSREALERAAREAFPDAQLLVADRGVVAESEIPSSLSGLRLTVLALLAVAAGLGLLAAGRLSAAERRKELAILAAVGADGRTLIAALLARSCLVGLAGGLVGILSAMAVAFGQDPASMSALPNLFSPLAVAVGAAVGLSGLTALPTALAAARVDPFQSLAES